MDERAMSVVVAVALLLTQDLPDPLQAGWAGERVCVLKHEDARVRMLECTFAPGIGHERHTHAPHIGYVIEGGRRRITDDAGTREIDVPSGVIWSRDEPYTHIAVNVGETTTRYLIIEPKQAQESAHAED
jgi:quercetin dioxygenase-like cupin family protein